MLFHEPECDFTLFTIIRKANVMTKNAAKFQTMQNYALQAELKLVPQQNMPWPSLFSEDIYSLVKSCSCFFEISYYCWYLILCCANSSCQILCPGSVCLEHNLDLSYFAPPQSSLFFGTLIKPWNMVSHQF